MSALSGALDLFCHCITSLLVMYWVSLGTLLGLVWHCIGPLLALYWVRFGYNTLSALCGALFKFVGAHAQYTHRRVRARSPSLAVFFFSLNEMKCQSEAVRPQNVLQSVSLRTITLHHIYNHKRYVTLRCITFITTTSSSGVVSLHYLDKHKRYVTLRHITLQYVTLP